MCIKFVKLKQRGVPGSLIRILVYWYSKQSMRVKWGNCLSAPFTVGNLFITQQAEVELCQDQRSTR